MKMRKQLLIVLMSLSSISLTAQESNYIDKIEKGDLVWIMSTGPLFNNVTGTGVDDVKAGWAAARCYGEYNDAFGWKASFGFCSPIGSPFYFGMNVSLGMRGYETSARWSKEISSIVSQTTRLTAFNAQMIPTSIGLAIKTGPRTAIDINAGLFLSIDFAGKLTTEVEKTKNNTTETSKTLNEIDGYSKYDIGVNCGVTFWWNNWGLGLNYQRGIASMYDDNIDVYSKSYQLSLNYAF